MSMLSRIFISAWVALFVALAAPSASQAASYTLNFTGTVSNTYGSFNAAGFAAGDAVSGSLTFDPVNTSSYSSSAGPFGGGNLFAQSAVSFTFSVTHPGGLHFSQSDAGTGHIGSAIFAPGPDFDILGFSGTGASSALSLSYETKNSNLPLTSLAGLPNTASGLLAFLGGTPWRTTGSFSLSNFDAVAFDISTAVVTTPIPGALLLFASALGGLGILGRRSRDAAANAA